MSAAPPERAGAASAVSETSFEFGGALGIAVLGSILTVRLSAARLEAADLTASRRMRRSRVRTTGSAARSTPRVHCRREQGARLLTTAHEAFVYAFEVTSAVSAVCAVLAAIFAATLLRGAGSARIAPRRHRIRAVCSRPAREGPDAAVAVERVRQRSADRAWRRVCHGAHHAPQGLAAGRPRGTTRPFVRQFLAYVGGLRRARWPRCGCSTETSPLCRRSSSLRRWLSP